MKRRAVPGGRAAAPCLISRACADASVAATAPSPSPSLAARLVRRGPTLAVPRPAEERRDRGAACGELLDHGGGDLLAPLATVDVECAASAELGVAGDPLLLFVDGKSVRPLDAALPQYHISDDGDDDQEAQTTAQRIAVPARLIHRSLEPCMSGATSTREDAALSCSRYRERPPRGARWARTRGCGTRDEEAPRGAMPDCGMGQVRAQSARFLAFHVRPLAPARAVRR